MAGGSASAGCASRERPLPHALLGRGSLRAEGIRPPPRAEGSKLPAHNHTPRTLFLENLEASALWQLANDLYWTDLALSRRLPLQAIVFEYRLLGIGLAWHGCRNVVSALGRAPCS